MDQLSMAEYMYEAKGYREWEQYCKSDDPELDEDGNPERQPEGNI